LGILDLAVQRGLIDLASAVARLKATNFRYRPEILDALLAAPSLKGQASLMPGQGGTISHEDTVANLTLFSRELLPRLREME
jgi:hypothetical protein